MSASLARDLGRALGCFGHVVALRRMRSARLHPEEHDSRWKICEALAIEPRPVDASLADALMPV